MKVQQIQQNSIKKNQSPQFKGLADETLRFLATNQAIGANAVDIGFMVVPRTGTDMVERGPVAGLETLRREASGTANHSLIGIYGAVSGALLAALMGVDKNFGTNANKIYAAPNTVNVLAEKKANQIKYGKTQLDYLRESLAELRAFNPSSKKADPEGFVRLSDKTINEIASIIDDSLNKNISPKKWENKKTSNSIQVAINKIIEDTGAESKYLFGGNLQKPDGIMYATNLTKATNKTKLDNETSLKTFLEDLYKLSDAFNKEKVKEAFQNQIRDNKPIAENAFVKKLSSFMKKRALAGFVIGSAIGMSIQPLNMYLTKLKTGSDGFVGVEGRSKDNSTGFKVLKGVAGAGFFGLTLLTLDTGLKGFMDKMSFKGFFPTINQLKGIYGLTIISRLLAARDKDELRESLTKDFLGFLSWLVLGDFVNKIAAEKLNISVMNRTKEVSEQGFWNRVFNSKLKTRDEILIETLAQNNIETVKKDGEKTIAKSFKELTKELNKLPENVRKATKGRLRALNYAQLAGYAFSGLVLGLGIPNLNIYITNTLDKKNKAKLAQQSE